jgi:flagellar protein FliL
MSGGQEDHMADAATADEKEPARVAAPVLPIKLIIIVVALALVVGVGGAVLAVKLLGGSGKAAESAEDQRPEATAKAEPRHEVAKQAPSGTPGVMFDLDPFIVNLADQPEIRYLKLTVKLEVESESVKADLSARVAQVRDTVLVLLSSKDVTTVRTSQGKFQLRDEITQRVNGLLPRPGVRSAYFTEFVVQ